MDSVVIDLSDLQNIYEFNKFLEIEGELEHDKVSCLDKALKNSLYKEKARAVIIQYDANLTDLSFLKYFPNLLTLIIKGKNITSLDGIETLKNSISLYLHTKRKRNFDFTAIKNKAFNTFSIDGLKTNEKDIFSLVSSIETLKLIGTDICDIALFKNLKVKELVISKWKEPKIKGLKCLNLTTLVLHGSRNLIEIQYDQKVTLKYLEIEACNNLDMSKIKKAIACKSLQIMSRSKGFCLQDLMDIESIADITITNLRADLQYESVSRVGKHLEKIHISPFAKAKLDELRARFPSTNWEN